MDVLEDGKFDKLDEKDRTRQITSDAAVIQAFWDDIRIPVSDTLHPMAPIHV